MSTGYFWDGKPLATITGFEIFAAPNANAHVLAWKLRLITTSDLHEWMFDAFDDWGDPVPIPAIVDVGEDE